MKQFSTRPSIRLPNVVDEVMFRDEVDSAREARAQIRARLGIDERPLFFCPARLIEAKGIVPFLTAIRESDRTFGVIIAGSGALRPDIERCTADGTATSLSWWGALRVEASAVVLDAATDAQGASHSLTIAEVGSDAEAKALFRSISDGMDGGGRAFDARQWPTLATRTREESADGAP